MFLVAIGEYCELVPLAVSLKRGLALACRQLGIDYFLDSICSRKRWRRRHVLLGMCRPSAQPGNRYVTGDRFVERAAQQGMQHHLAQRLHEFKADRYFANIDG